MFRTAAAALSAALMLATPVLAQNDDTPETSGLNCIDLNGDGDTNDVIDGVNGHSAHAARGRQSEHRYPNWFQTRQPRTNMGSMASHETCQLEEPAVQK